jgi:hypothetical protein
VRLMLQWTLLLVLTTAVAPCTSHALAFLLGLGGLGKGITPRPKIVVLNRSDLRLGKASTQSRYLKPSNSTSIQESVKVVLELGGKNYTAHMDGGRQVRHWCLIPGPESIVF